jgi:hypothetical protein
MALTRLVGFRSALGISIAALVSVAWYPGVSLALVLGGVAGIGNMLLVMRGNERFLDRRIGRVQRASANLQRLVVLATVLVVTTLWSPWWAMGVTFCGIYLPFVLYGLETHRRFQMEGML